MTDSILEASSAPPPPQPALPLPDPLTTVDTTVDAWLARLAPAHRTLLYQLLPLAEPCGVQLFLVGGLVRDLFLGRSSPDLDLMLEGPDRARETFAQRAVQTLGWKATIHPRFLTWRLEGPDGHLDLVSSRQEVYRAPAQLPDVAPGPVLEDLSRRDFTLNSMAVALTGASAGQLLDPLGGRSDLAAGMLRVLHPASFLDDPTRIVRGLRFAARLGLAFEPSTLVRLEEALKAGVLALLSGDRVAHELTLLLSEPSGGEGVRLGVTLGVWEGLEMPPPGPARLEWLCSHPAQSEEVSAILEQAHRRAALPTAPPALWLLRLGLLLLDSPSSTQERALTRLSITGRAHPAWRQALQETDTLLSWLDQAACASERVFTLEGCSIERLALVLAEALRLGPPGMRVAERVRAYLREQRFVRSPLDGHALMRLGWKPGPGLRDALRFLRGAALDEGWGEEEARRWAQSPHTPGRDPAGSPVL